MKDADDLRAQVEKLTARVGELEVQVRVLSADALEKGALLWGTEARAGSGVVLFHAFVIVSGFINGARFLEQRTTLRVVLFRVY